MIGELFFNSFVGFADVAKRKCLTKSSFTKIQVLDYQSLRSTINLRSFRNRFEKCPIRVTKPRTIVRGYFVWERRELGRKSGQTK